MSRIAHSVALSLFLLAAFALAPFSAQAQSDVRALYDRIDRLERDLQMMQSQAARGGSVPMRAPAASDGSVAGNMASRLEDRINELEDANRFLTGKIEESNFRINQLNKQIERMQTDVDLRFKDMQDPKSASSSNAPTQLQPSGVSMPATQPNGAPVLIPPKGVNPGSNSADNDGPAPGPQVLGQLNQKDAKRAEAQAQSAAPATPAAPAVPKDPIALFDSAKALAEKGDFDGAEQRFQLFLKTHPNHQLAGDAQYWVGDIAFSQRKDFEAAAKQFADAYKKYPKSAKAPDMLYKLGASFSQMGEKTQACKVYGLLGQAHPDMSDRLKRAVAGEKTKLACK